MPKLTTNEAAKKLGISLRHLQRLIAAGKIKAPPIERVGVLKFRLWSAADIARVRRQMRLDKEG